MPWWREGTCGMEPAVKRIRKETELRILVLNLCTYKVSLPRSQVSSCKAVEFSYIQSSGQPTSEYGNKKRPCTGLHALSLI
jgi:hypothetical protein